MISVILCLYNGEKFIEDQLTSLLDQSKVPDEVLLIDDCSTDNTINICENFISNHGLSLKWKIIRNSINKGWKRNFFEAISCCNGEFVFFCDQDDIWSHDKIFETYNAFLKNKNATVVSCYERLLFANKLGKSISRNEDIILDTKSLDIINIANNFSGSCMCIRKSFYQKIKTFWNCDWAHDNFFWLFSYVNSSLYVIKKDLILHRITGCNSSRIKSNLNQRIKIVRGNIYNIECVLRYAEENINNSFNSYESRKIKKIYKANLSRLKFLTSKFLWFYYGLVTIIVYPYVYYTKRTFIGDILAILKGIGRK